MHLVPPLHVLLVESQLGPLLGLKLAKDGIHIHPRLLRLSDDGQPNATLLFDLDGFHALSNSLKGESGMRLQADDLLFALFLDANADQALVALSGALRSESRGILCDLAAKLLDLGLKIRILLLPLGELLLLHLK